MQITDGKSIFEVHHGVSQLSLISAAGCTVTAMIAAFLMAAESISSHDRMCAAAFGLAIFGYGHAQIEVFTSTVNSRQVYSSTAKLLSSPGISHYRHSREMASVVLAAMAYCRYAGEVAAIQETRNCEVGPGTLRVRLIDALYELCQRPGIYVELPFKIVRRA